MTFQHIARATAVADFVPDVERGPLLVAVEQLSWISTGVAGQSWRKRGEQRDDEAGFGGVRATASGQSDKGQKILGRRENHLMALKQQIGLKQLLILKVRYLPVCSLRFKEM